MVDVTLCFVRVVYQNGALFFKAVTRFPYLPYLLQWCFSIASIWVPWLSTRAWNTV